MLHLFFAIPCVYVIARFVLPLALPLWATLGAILLLLAGAEFHLWNRLSSGSVFSPEFPRALVIAFNVAFGAILFLAVLQFALDVGTALVSLWRGHWIGIAPGARAAIALLALALAGVGVSQAIKVPGVRDVTIAIADLPPQFAGYQILQLTDLHISRLFETPWAEQVVARANAVGANLIAITGDFIDGTVEKRWANVEPLRGLAAPDGVFAVPGNHEYFFDAEAWLRHFQSFGIRMLVNDYAVIERAGAGLVLAGVADLSAGEVGLPGPDLAKALAGAPEAMPVILLDHQPRNARKSAAAGVALQLSGHTHGGMILGFHWLLERMNGGFVSGLYAVDRMSLYVSNGTGIWPGFALRLGKPAEMTRITLRRS